jgi:hypothetical protein
LEATVAPLDTLQARVRGLGSFVLITVALSHIRVQAFHQEPPPFITEAALKQALAAAAAQPPSGGSLQPSMFTSRAAMGATQRRIVVQAVGVVGLQGSAAPQLQLAQAARQSAAMEATVATALSSLRM